SEVLWFKKVSCGQPRFGVRRNFFGDVSCEGNFLNRKFVAATAWCRYFVERAGRTFANRYNGFGGSRGGRRRCLLFRVAAGFKRKPRRVALHHVRGNLRSLLFQFLDCDEDRS